jgi:isopenicillin-N epimerase
MREHFLLDGAIVFLNHGSFGACPRPVLERYHELQREIERRPMEMLARRSAALLLEAREALAGYLGATAADLVFVTNATTGVNTVARSLQLSPGDEIVTTDHEYGACDATWRFVCERTGARYVPLEVPLPFDAAGFADRVWAAVGPRTRVLYLSHITSTTALILPIAELCRRAREAGILTLIDGAHAPGQIDLDLDALGADFYTGNCHKWLCAPKGAGFLYVRPEHHAALDATTISWGYAESGAGHAGAESITGTTTLERRLQWQGTRDLAAFLAVPAAIEFQRAHGWGEVRRGCHALAARTLERACALTGLVPVCGDADFAQMVVIPVPPADQRELQRRLLEEFRIEIPATTHAGRLFVRLSVQAYTTETDCDALLAALAAIFGK